MNCMVLQEKAFGEYYTEKGRGFATNWKAINIDFAKLKTAFDVTISYKDGSKGISLYFYFDMEIIRISDHWVEHLTQDALLNGQSIEGKTYAGIINMADALAGDIARKYSPKVRKLKSEIEADEVSNEEFKIALGIAEAIKRLNY